MHGRIVAWVVVLAGCGASVESTVTPSPPPAAAAPAEVRAAITIGGRLQGHDGAPLRKAEFVVLRNGFDAPTAKGPLAADGSFRVEVEPGVYWVSVAAVDHAQFGRVVLVERSLEVRGRLGTYARQAPGERLPLRSELLGAGGEVIGAGPGSAARGAAGRYRVTLADRPKAAVKLRYQLVNGDGGRSYNGPLADSYENDGGGDYWSVVDIAGRDAIELDLSRLPPAGVASRLTWSGESAEVAAMRAFQDRWNPRVQRLLAEMPRKDGKLLEPDANSKAASAAAAAEAMAEVEAAGPDAAQVLLRLAHLDLFVAFDDTAAMNARAEWLVAHVDPADPRLALAGNVFNVLGGAFRSGDPEFAARVEGWLERAQANPDAATALNATVGLLYRADERGDDARVAALYAATQAPRFAGTWQARYVAQQFDPDRVLQRGKPLPGFEFAALARDGRAVTSAERAGRLYLVEFWATWCGPCVADMPELHAAYAAVNGARPGKGKEGLRRLRSVERPRLEFVFVSLDQSAGDVEKFREQHWSMPWTHAFVGRAGEQAVMARLGFSGVPTAVLVDGQGIIREVGGALRGERLLPTLEKALASTSEPTKPR